MIEIKNVSFAYRVSDTEGRPILRPAVKDINLKINSGEFLVLTGSSGCGKTTVCRLINGLIPHYFEGEKKGEVLINGTDVAAQPIYETARLVGSVFQNPRSQFFNVDTTSELAFAAENQGRDPEMICKDIEQVSDLLELSPLLGRSMFKLSGGEKQKIACGTVAVADPSIIVLDEPSSNLDMDGIEELRKTLALWKSQGKTVIIAEHRLFFLRELADRVVLFEDGVITRQFSSEEFSGLTISETSSLGLRAATLSELPAHENFTSYHRQTITLEEIEFTYSDKLHGIRIPSLELPQNEIIAIIGHNGAGKSTFVRTLCGLNKKAKGSVLLNGKKIPVSKMLGHCYMIMQDVNHQLFTESVLEEVLLSVPETLPEDSRDRKAREALKFLDMDAFNELHPMALSGGQKQRVAIACGLASDKEIILLDEPTSGLDYMHMKQVADVLRMLRERGKTVLVITHDLELISCCAAHVLHLEKGSVHDNYAVGNTSISRMKEFFVQK
ncbi:MAG: ABC transporter ATP-binding protein [Lachnospiraceae bacterium]